jgi:cobalamin synthase
LLTAAILLTWIVLYSYSDERTHMGSLFGNAIADWSGVLVTVLATKHLYERGSKESKQPRGELHDRALEAVREHSLTIFLVVTGVAWALIYARMNSEARWGAVVGNIVSEWSQLIGTVLMTKKLIETGSKESANDK